MKVIIFLKISSLFVKNVTNKYTGSFFYTREIVRKGKVCVLSDRYFAYKIAPATLFTVAGATGRKFHERGILQGTINLINFQRQRE